MRAHAPVEAAVAEHPLDLVGEQQQGRQRRRVVGLLLARVLERGLQREEVRLPAVAGAVELLDPGDRGRAEQRQPEAAVGAEGLLRGEVVGVGLRRRRPAGRRRRRWRRSGPGRRRRRPGARPSTITPVEVSLWAQAMTSAAGSAIGSGASPGSASTRIGSARNGARGGRLGELRGELAVGEVQGALAHEPGGGGVPEGGGAAVAERDLVAVGQREELAEAARGRGGPGRGPAPGGARCPSDPRARPAPPAPPGAPSRDRSRSGRRPASARRESGRCRWSAGAIGLDRLLTRRGWTDAGAGARLGSAALSVPVRTGGGAMYPISYEADFNPTPNRWTTFFRLILAIPWFIVATFWGILFVFTHLFAWVAVVILGRYPQWLYDFNSGVVRFSIRVIGLDLPADRRLAARSASATIPATRSGSTSRPAAERQSRLKALFRDDPGAAGAAGRSPTGPPTSSSWPRVVAWLTIVFRGYLPEGDQQHADLRQQLPRPRLRLHRAPHRRLPADRARAGEGAPDRPGRRPRPRRTAGVRRSETDDERRTCPRARATPSPTSPTSARARASARSARSWGSPPSASTRSCCRRPTRPAATTTTSRRSSTSSTAAKSSSSFGDGSTQRLGPGGLAWVTGRAVAEFDLDPARVQEVDPPARRRQ